MCAAMIVDDLPSWTDQRFLMAVREYRRSANFIPTTADLIKAYNAIPAHTETLAALPAGKSPAEYAAIAAKWGPMVRKLMGGKL